MAKIGIHWVGEAPNDSRGRLAAFIDDDTVIGEGVYRQWEHDPDLILLSGFTVETEYRHRGIATEMMHTVFDQLGRDRQFVVTIHGNLGRVFMEVIAAEEGAPKLFEMVEDDSLRPMN
ncbi:GNAT family N-acetyltransferase [Arthrobacter rhombi]|uniref:GNAT family N-acetyltransferase n=1 Tax=Arthrobacter rhombi TaxID=71253 RepID=UPI003FD3A39E